MTIEKGAPWGEEGPLAGDGVVVRDDQALRAVVEDAMRSGAPLPEIGLLGGDLCRTVGGRGDAARLRSVDATRLPIDVGRTEIDGVEHWFVAHLVARRSWWRGRVVAVMNAQWIGAWDVAPRSHPNDGLLDVFDGDLGFDDRIKARHRLPTGTHVPHPGIRQRRVRSLELEFATPTPIHLDGTVAGRVTALSVTLLPDLLTCVV
ncbi:MAG: hypothetical protein GX643_18040 [Acidimicrobiales bacterium]|nr:hypothetical protein [Acidimicrobiales bacterium]